LREYLQLEALKSARDEARGEHAKELLSLFADQQLPKADAGTFKAAMVASGPWKDNSKASNWIRQWLIEHPNVPRNFLKSLRVLSQDHSTGMYIHATEMRHTAGKREEGILLKEETESKKFTYSLISNGEINMKIDQKLQLLQKEGNATNDSKVATLSLHGAWEFDDKIQIKKAGYEASNLQINEDGLHAAAADAI
jgi:hypothetical protein